MNGVGFSASSLFVIIFVRNEAVSSRHPKAVPVMMASGIAVLASFSAASAGGRCHSHDPAHSPDRFGIDQPVVVGLNRIHTQAGMIKRFFPKKKHWKKSPGLK
jgi:hypothetical protein